MPRLPEQTGTFTVQLQRRLQYKSSALALNIRPHKVLQAARWLTNSSKLYKEGIAFNPEWNVGLNKDTATVDENDYLEKANYGSSENDNDDKIPTGVTDTMLTAPGYLNDSEREEKAI